MNKSRLMGAMCAYLTIVSLNANSATFDNFLVPIGNDHLQGNGVSNTFINNLTVDGRWFLSATSLSTDMFFDGTQTVGGTGEIILSDSANNRWLGDATNTITVGSGLTVRGAGKIALNLPSIINNGAFLAQGSNAELLIQTSSFTNNGVLRAEGSQGLHLSGVSLSNNTSVDVNTGSALQLTNSNVNGVFNIANGATATASSTIFDAVTIDGDIQHSNGQSNFIKNGLTLNGTWNLNASSGTTDMGFLGTQSIGGVGEIVMSDSINNRISGGLNALSLTVDSGITIRGAGKIGLNLGSIINNGTFLAQGSNAELLIQSIAFTNNGVLRAEGSQGLHLSGVSLSNNTSVDVNTGSALQLTNSNVNGVFNIANGATATASSTIFDAVTIDGDMQQNNSKSNDFKNGLTLNGTWNLNASSGTTDMGFQGTQSIGGVGEIVMSDSINNRISGDLNALTVGSDITIRGAGKIGLNLGNIINNGEFLAQGSNAELLIQTSSFTNNGVLRAEGSQGLHLSGVSLSNNTSVDVNTGSALQLTNSNVNGVFNIANGATATASSTIFDAVTIDGDIQHSNGQSNFIKNGLTLNGTWNLNAIGSSTSMNFNGTQTIGGNGEIVMSDTPNSRILGDGSNTITVDIGTTIRGAGEINSNINNQGTIIAQGIVSELRIKGNAFTNNGKLLAEGPKDMNITSSSFTTNGLVEIAFGSQLTRTGTYVQTDGQTNVDGVLEQVTADPIDLQGGELTGDGQINGAVANSGGTVAMGKSPGHLSINGDYSQSAGGTLEVEIGGLLAGTGYDWLDVSGEASLDGILNVSLFDAGSGLFAPSLGDTFDILSATDIVGEFDVLMLAALGSGLDWDVNYILDASSTDFVRLSVVSAVPVPAAVWLFGSGLLGLIGVSRRKKAA